MIFDIWMIDDETHFAFDPSQMDHGICEHGRMNPFINKN